MTPRERTNAPAPIPIMTAHLAIATMISYQCLLVVLIFLRPDLAPSWHSISEWAIGPYGWVMSGAFLVSAVAYGAMLAMLKSQLRGWMGRVGLAILFICFIGAFGVGVCTTDPMPFHLPLTTRGTLHVIFGTSQLMLFPFAALFISLSLALKNPAWGSARPVLLWIAALPLFGWACFVAYTAIYVVPLGQMAHGPGVNIGWPPRFAFLTYALWVIATASQGIRVQKQEVSVQAKLNGRTHLYAPRSERSAH